MEKQLQSIDLKEINLKLKDFHFELEKNILGLKLIDNNPSDFLFLRISFSNEIILTPNSIWINNRTQLKKYLEDFERYSKVFLILKEILESDETI